jgi:heterodisulfide reductase subunit C
MLRDKTLTYSPSLSLLETIYLESGENINLCYQCKKCTTGCPMSYAMDYTPTQIIHAIRIGMQEMVFNSKTPWLCASCETCTNRCPQDIDIAKVMDTVRIIAQRQGIAPPITTVVPFYKATLNNIKLLGRMYEIGMLADFKFRTKQFKKDIGLGMKMFIKGKLKLIPSLNIARTLSTWKIFSRVKKRETER